MGNRNRQAMAAQAASEAGRVLQSVKAEQSVEPQVVDEHVKPEIVRERPPPRDEPRRQAMDELVEKDLERRGIKEPKPEAVIPDNPPPPTPEQMLEGGKFSEPTPEPVQDEAPAEVVPEPIKTVRVKVDGDEFDVPQEEVDEAGGVKSYQILKASENRLRKANDTLAKAQAQFAEWANKQTAQPVPTEDEFIASKIDAIRFGTPEESAAALREVMQIQKVDPQQIIEQATDRIRHDSAVAKFDSEFSDISANPLLLKLTVALRQERLQQVQQAYQTGQLKGPLDWNKFYSTIGNEVRSVIGRQSQPTTTPNATGNPSQSEKEARKASIVNLPTAAASRAVAPEAPKQESREDTLNLMRKSRGIPTG